MICDGSRLMRYPRSVVLSALSSACIVVPPVCIRLLTARCPKCCWKIILCCSCCCCCPSRCCLRFPSKLSLLVVVVVLVSRFGRFSLCASACSRRGLWGAWSAFCWPVFIVAAGWLLMVVAGVVRHVLVVPFSCRVS